MAKLHRHELHEKLGLQQGKDFTYTDAPGYRVYEYWDSAVIKLFEIKDQIGDSTLLEYVEKNVEGAKARRSEAQRRAEEKRRETEAAKAREAERQAKLDAAFVNELRRDFLLANPGASESDFQAALPALKSAEQIRRMRSQKEALAREYAAKFSSGF